MAIAAVASSVDGSRNAAVPLPSPPHSTYSWCVIAASGTAYVLHHLINSSMYASFCEQAVLGHVWKEWASGPMIFGVGMPLSGTHKG